jgi:hypothetical protein
VTSTGDAREQLIDNNEQFESSDSATTISRQTKHRRSATTSPQRKGSVKMLRKSLSLIIGGIDDNADAASDIAMHMPLSPMALQRPDWKIREVSFNKERSDSDAESLNKSRSISMEPSQFLEQVDSCEVSPMLGPEDALTPPLLSSVSPLLSSMLSPSSTLTGFTHPRLSRERSLELALPLLQELSDISDAESLSGSRRGSLLAAGGLSNSRRSSLSGSRRGSVQTISSRRSSAEVAAIALLKVTPE